MLDRLRISDEVFAGLTSALASAQADLDATEHAGDGVADAVGHRGLSNELHAFTHNWRITREKLVGSMTSLRSQLDGVVETFTSTDRKIGDSMRPSTGGGQSTPGSGQGGATGQGGGSAQGGSAPTAGDGHSAHGGESVAQPASPMPAAPHDAPAAPAQEPDLGSGDLIEPVSSGADSGTGAGTGTDSGTGTDGATDTGTGTDGDTSAEPDDVPTSGVAEGPSIPGDPVDVPPDDAAHPDEPAPTDGGAVSPDEPAAPDAGGPADGPAGGGADPGGSGTGPGGGDAAIPEMPDAPTDDVTTPVVDPQGGSAVDGGGTGTAPDPAVAGGDPDGSGDAHSDAFSAPAAMTPMVGGAAMGGMAAMSGSGASAASGGRADAAVTHPRGDQERAREARELLQKLHRQRKEGDPS